MPRSLARRHRRRAAAPRVATAVLTLAPLPTLASCGEPAPEADPLDLDRIPSLGVEEGLRIGDLEDPDVGFSRVSDVDVDADGNVYAGEVMAREIRVFRPDGSFLRRIGRSGQGPGEFQESPSFGVVGDTVWAIDARAPRITLFRRDGTLLSTAVPEDVRVALPSGWGYVRPEEMVPGGLFTSRMSMLAYARGENSDVDRSDPMPVPRVRFDAKGRVVDTVGWDERPPPFMVAPPGYPEAKLETVDVAGTRHIVPGPPPIRPQWLTLPDGRISIEPPLTPAADGAVLTVVRLDLAEDTVWRRDLGYRPVPYTSADLDSVAARTARQGGPFVPVGGSAPDVPPDEAEAIAAALRAAMDFPEFRAPVRWGWVDDDGRVWLQRDDPDGPTARWIVLGDDGLPRGQVTLPSNVTPRWSAGDVAWAVETDDLGVPWLVRYRLTGID